MTNTFNKTKESAKFFTDLNQEQKQAVTAAFGNTLVLAGAGSGKTRVLVHRIAYLLEEKLVLPSSILAVTFTNKAAHEMRSRLEQMLGRSLQSMWVGTFHGLAHRLLRLHWQDAGLIQNFQILDSDDQLRIIKRIHKALNLAEERWQAKESQYFINSNKDEGLRAHKITNIGGTNMAMWVRIYEAYEETCQQNGLVDFAELLLRSHELWQKSPDILAHYQQRFQHILVDEFQDTNSIQYAWVRALSGNKAEVMAVGDDDQSIYSWRGAKIENILRFERDYHDVHVIRLEQNYRSTSVILEAANAIIANNTNRMGKNLWTEGDRGEPIGLYSAFNELDEAQFIISCLRGWFDQGNPYKDAAILYRSNAQSRVLEEYLLQAGIPYRIYGGLRFYERAEIKDTLAYLRLIANRHDDDAFERVVNTPTRGIGNTTLQLVRDYARANKISLWDATQIMTAEKKLSARAASALVGFLTLIDQIAEHNLTHKLHEHIDYIIKTTGLLAHFAKDKNQRGEAKIENLDELITAAERFVLRQEREPNEENLPPLAAFLAHASLEAGEMQAEEFEDSVQLMTLHSAKGLEFPLVFLTGMEEYLFPHQMSMGNPRSLEEERRLCYVGITRAMKKLYLTYATLRRLHGTDNYRRPSRFLSEIPKELIKQIR